MEYTIDEKRAIIEILTLIMEADTIIHPKEIEYMNQIFIRLGITDAELDHMEMLDFDRSKKIFSTMTKNKKIIAIQMFADMAIADGYLDKREDVIIKKMKKL